MKTLQQYIREARNTLSSLPFEYELFEEFMQEAIIEGEYDDAVSYNKIRDCIVRGYGVSVWDMFKGWCESYLSISKEKTIREFYNDLFKIPLDRLNRGLGAGSYGVVMDVGSDKVIKWFYSDMESNDEKFLRYFMKNKSKYFPVVYKMGKNWVVLEKLKVGTPRVKQFVKTTLTKVEGKDVEDWVKEYYNNENCALPEFSKEERGAFEWCLGATIELTQCMGEPSPGKPWFIGDFKSSNIGLRKNGDIICFDI